MADSRFLIILAILGLAACAGDADDAASVAEPAASAPPAPAATAAPTPAPAAAFGGDASAIINMLKEDQKIYGVFVPPDDNGAFTADAAEALGANPYLDFIFLDLEGNPYDINAVHAYVEGLSRLDAADRTTLLVRVPTIDSAGYELTQARTAEVLAAGADGVVFPHILSVEMATRVTGFWADLDVDVWSPANPNGNIITMLMLEDPDAIDAAGAIADVGGYSLLSCGLGSLSNALGSPEAGEAGCLAVLEQGNRVGMPHIQLAFDTQIVQRRIEQGFHGMLMIMNEDMPNIVRAGWAATPWP
jgi:2-keto-3-deoxy-L-rhamnonate aldolase RhmA